MKKLNLIITLIISLNCFAQNQEFSLEKEKSIELRKSFGISYPDVYKVSLTKIDLIEFDTIITKTQEYKKKLEEDKKNKEDSLANIKRHSNSLKDYDRIKEIEKNIDMYLNKRGSFNKRKEYLINAQILSDSLTTNPLFRGIPRSYIKPGGGVVYSKNVIYADREINSEQKKDFADYKTYKGILEKQLKIIARNAKNHKKPELKESIKTRMIGSSNYFEKPIVKYNYEFVPKDTLRVEGYKISNQNESFSELEGDFVIKYFENDLVGNIDKGVLFLNNNLPGIDIVNNELEKIRNGYLFQNKNTKEIFFSSDRSVINEYSISGDIKMAYNKLKENGYKTSQNGVENYIVLSNKKIKINKAIIENVNNENIKYIDKIASSVDKFNALANKAEPLFRDLMKKINSYRSGTLTTSKLNEWKSECKNGQKIINEFKEIYEVDKYYFVDFVDSEKLKSKTNLINSVLVSERLIGM